MLTNEELALVREIARSPSFVKQISQELASRLRREYYRRGGRYLKNCECTLHDVCVFLSLKSKNHDKD